MIGAHAYQIDEQQAWAVVAGLTVGQDLSERIMQRSGPAPQFGLAKSFPGFGPTGPVLVTPDEFDDADDLEIRTTLSGEQMQLDRTAGMVFSIPTLVSWLSHVTPLFPGDIIFTGTPSGIGMSRTPPRFLQVGDELATHIEGIGTIRSGSSDSTTSPPLRRRPLRPSLPAITASHPSFPDFYAGGPVMRPPNAQSEATSSNRSRQEAM